ARAAAAHGFGAPASRDALAWTDDGPEFDPWTLVGARWTPKTEKRRQARQRQAGDSWLNSEALFRTRTGDPLLTMELPRQLVAAGGNGFGLFSALSRLIDLPLIVACCNHGAP